jgi:hypothetical protein
MATTTNVRRITTHEALVKTEELRHARVQRQAYLQRYRQHYEEIAATDQLFIAC